MGCGSRLWIVRDVTLACHRKGPSWNAWGSSYYRFPSNAVVKTMGTPTKGMRSRQGLKHVETRQAASFAVIPKYLKCDIGTFKEFMDEVTMVSTA